MEIVTVSTRKRGEVWFTEETSPQLEQTAALAREDVADAQGCARASCGCRRVRWGMLITAVCSRGQEVACAGRNWQGRSSETEVLGEELGRPGGVLLRGDRGETERRGKHFKVRGQGAE